MSQMNAGQEPEQKQSFLDRGTIVALVLVMGVWFGWSKWVEKMYPQPATIAQPIGSDEKVGDKPASAASSASAQANSAPVPSAEVKSAVANTQEMVKIAAQGKVAEAKQAIDNPHWNGQLSTWGMGLSSVELKKYKTRDDKPIFVGATPYGLFGTRLIGSTEPIVFSVSKKSDTEWVGISNFGAFTVEKTVMMVTEPVTGGNSLKITTVAKGDLANFPGFTTVVSDEVKPPASTSILAPSYDHHDWYVRHDDTNTRLILSTEKPEELNLKTALTVALSSQYFTAALADHSDLRPDFRGGVPLKNGETYHATGTLDYKPSVATSEFKVEQIGYIGAKDVDTLRAADTDFARVVDYGMFAVLADPLLWLMRFFHRLFGNWGFAIIGLTLVVRAIVLPFNLYSFKSMKVMQKLQPQIQQVKEKFKEDPRRMNEEVMRLMKENKANPIGGCLPMLIQLPVFFALYQVLAQSMELYRQPFILWIHDLTVKDPYFVLPVLMGVAMYFQQKLTPVADPQQAKILQWMPVIFSFLMFTLPSGLTLYIFVSTLFGIAQQYVFMKDKSAATPQNNVREAKA